MRTRKNDGMVVSTTTETTSTSAFATSVMENTYSICKKKIASVPVELMALDYSYQRGLRSIKKLMKEWDDEKCDFLKVSYRDGKFYIIDGQHRYTVAKAKGIASLPCIIFTGLTRKDEARKFVEQDINNMKLTNYDIFFANLANGDRTIPEVVRDMEIDRICKKYNVVIKRCPGKEAKALRCLSRSQWIVEAENGSDCFDWILKMITSTDWDRCPTSYTREIVWMLRNYYMENVNNLTDVEVPLMALMNTNPPKDVISTAKAVYDYGIATAMDLCLRDLLAGKVSIVRGEQQ